MKIFIMSPPEDNHLKDMDRDDSDNERMFTLRIKLKFIQTFRTTFQIFLVGLQDCTMGIKNDDQENFHQNLDLGHRVELALGGHECKEVRCSDRIVQFHLYFIDGDYVDQVFLSLQIHFQSFAPKITQSFFGFPFGDVYSWIYEIFVFDCIAMLELFWFTPRFFLLFLT